jgi:hypothetical protein
MADRKTKFLSSRTDGCWRRCAATASTPICPSDDQLDVVTGNDKSGQHIRRYLRTAEKDKR